MRTELLTDCTSADEAMNRIPWAATVRRVDGGWRVFESLGDAAALDRQAPTVAIGRNALTVALGCAGMGSSITEDVFQAWFDVAAAHLCDAAGFHVSVTQRREHDAEQSTVIVAAGHDVAETIQAALDTLLAQWCAGGWRGEENY
jgi:hypothetical protein